MANLVLDEAERVEMVASAGARLRELDSAFKKCMKSDVKGAAEEVNRRIKTVKGVVAKLEE